MKLFPCVTWPSINRDVTKDVREYCPCQKQAKCNRAPLPIIAHLSSVLPFI